MRAASHEEWRAGIKTENNSVFPIRAGYMPSSQPLEEFPWPCYLVVKFLAPGISKQMQMSAGRGSDLKRSSSLSLPANSKNSHFRKHDCIWIKVRGWEQLGPESGPGIQMQPGREVKQRVAIESKAEVELCVCIPREQ